MMSWPELPSSVWIYNDDDDTVNKDNDTNLVHLLGPIECKNEKSKEYQVEWLSRQCLILQQEMKTCVLKWKHLQDIQSSITSFLTMSLSHENEKDKCKDTDEIRQHEKEDQHGKEEDEWEWNEEEDKADEYEEIKQDEYETSGIWKVHIQNTNIGMYIFLSSYS